MATQQNYLVTPEHKLVYQQLVEIAKRKGAPIGYSVIFNIMKLKPGQHAAYAAGQLLDDINQHANLQGKPMLSALVINQSKKMPGEGFYGLAYRLGKLHLGATDEEKKAFWKAELQRVYEAEW